ncbi:MAG: hypothetical protein KBB32_12900 [Spirochaetia bacterium]|nr:hypothetical protein [Spirochaetia bacterium]
MSVLEAEPAPDGGNDGRFARPRVGRVLAATLLALVMGAAVWANPFYGTAEGEPQAPVSATRGASGPLVELQRRFRDSLADAFGSAQTEGAASSLAAVLGLAFLYGLAHAAGPGHRKTVVFSLFLGSKRKAWEPMAAGLLAATTHTLSGGLLILALSVIRGMLASLASAEAVMVWMDGISLVILAALGLTLAIIKIVRLAKGSAHNHSAKGRGTYGIIFFSSLVPCTGTIMVLLFALYMDAIVLGLLALVAIALGQAVIVALAAYLAWFGREGLFGRLKAKERLVANISGALEVLSYAAITVFSLWAAWPFLLSVTGLA